MASRRAVIALLLVQLIALAASAQSEEFGRATSGEIVMTPKGSAPLSGSLELSLSTGNDIFGRSSSPAYGITAGGTLLQDRLWFFAAASRQELSQTRFAELELPENATAGAIGAKVNGQIAGGHDFSAFFEAARRPELSMTTPSAFAGIAPSSFLSLRYTGVVSSNMFFTASVTRSSRTVQGLGFMDLQP
ncbi:MAG TPA: hypothetical protein VNA69_06630 [Thermoanaerobaculia bacterium]|nr:hypothetical protein [Thermoanaerobaculia bacterium]